MFHLFAALCAGALGTVVDWVFPAATAGAAGVMWASIPHNVVGAAVAAVAVFGLFVDLPLFFSCVYLVMAFRLVFLAYRVYMTIKSAIPLIG